MKIIKTTILGIGFLLGASSISPVIAQTLEDALRYSQYNATGSARVMGIGGSQFAIGGDVSNISGNPAGLGFFRKSEFSFTPSYGNWKSTSSFMDQPQVDNKGNFALPNISIVMAKVKDPLNQDAWRGHSFGISFNRISNFNNTFGYYSTIGSPSSLLDYYADDYNMYGEPAIGDPAGLPLDVELVINEGGTFYPSDYTYNPNDDGSPNYDNPIAPFQDELIENEGNLSQITFAYGGNYKNKLFIGGSVGITSINYTSRKVFNEQFIDQDENNSLYYSLAENLYHSGAGVNLNLGLIYKPIDQINIGASFSSPTWARYDEEFDSDIIAEFYDLNGNPEAEDQAYSDIFVSSINLTTPMRLSGGVAFFINKNGFITADVDYLNYSSMNLSSSDYRLDAANENIDNTMGNVLNYRIGGEWRINMFRLRAGTALYGDPYKDSELDRSKTQFTGGVGVKLAKMYVDLGIVHSQFDSYYTSYPGAELTTIDNSNTQGLLTLGFNF
ncbi:OmpP1/FadL family transporter [Echinicola rosea]|uniref:Transporter n=1 Tax=Echinicola rosea TaxID=1807691 RepID=A0ABQ1ULF7_9BACT|nr:outer membrane protein transport protein [Echinicola rosea]GGF19974.1 transporter [Echinicola rosea]